MLLLTHRLGGGNAARPSARESRRKASILKGRVRIEQGGGKFNAAKTLLPRAAATLEDPVWSASALLRIPSDDRRNRGFSAYSPEPLDGSPPRIKPADEERRIQTPT